MDRTVLGIKMEGAGPTDGLADIGITIKDVQVHYITNALTEFVARNLKYLFEDLTKLVSSSAKEQTI